MGWPDPGWFGRYSSCCVWDTGWSEGHSPFWRGLKIHRLTPVQTDQRRGHGMGRRDGMCENNWDD